MLLAWLYAGTMMASIDAHGLVASRIGTWTTQCAKMPPLHEHNFNMVILQHVINTALKVFMHEMCAQTGALQL